MGQTTEFDQAQRQVRPGPYGPNPLGPILQELKECPLQPGRLRISKQGCGLRYLRAREIKLRVSRTAFEMIYQHGLDICLTCSEGRLYAKGIPYWMLEKGNRVKGARKGTPIPPPGR